MRTSMPEHAGATKRRRIQHALQFRGGVGGAYGIAIEPAHGAIVMPAMPTNVKRVLKARGTAKVAQQNGSARFCNPRKFGEKVPRLRKVVQHRIADH